MSKLIRITCKAALTIVAIVILSPLPPMAIMAVAEIWRK